MLSVGGFVWDIGDLGGRGKGDLCDRGGGGKKRRIMVGLMRGHWWGAEEEELESHVNKEGRKGRKRI